MTATPSRTTFSHISRASGVFLENMRCKSSNGMNDGDCSGLMHWVHNDRQNRCCNGYLSNPVKALREILQGLD